MSSSVASSNFAFRYLETSLGYVVIINKNGLKRKSSKNAIEVWQFIEVGLYTVYQKTQTLTL